MILRLKHYCYNATPINADFTFKEKILKRYFIFFKKVIKIHLFVEGYSSTCASIFYSSLKSFEIFLTIPADLGPSLKQNL